MQGLEEFKMLLELQKRIVNINKKQITNKYYFCLTQRYACVNQHPLIHSRIQNGSTKCLCWVLQNKNSINHLRCSSLSSLSSNTQSYTKLLQLKSTNKNARMSFTKLKAISHSLCKALGIPLYFTFTNIRLLYIANIRT